MFLQLLPGFIQLRTVLTLGQDLQETSKQPCPKHQWSELSLFWTLLQTFVAIQHLEKNYDGIPNPPPETGKAGKISRDAFSEGWET